MMEITLDIRCLRDEFGHRVRCDMRKHMGRLQFDFYCQSCDGPVFIDGLPRPIEELPPLQGPP